MLSAKDTPTTPPHRVLISSRDSQALQALTTACQGLSNITVSSRLVSNGHTDPLYDIERPDLLLLRVSDLWRDELQALLARPRGERPPLLICGALDVQEGLRLAMQAGACDYLPEPVQPEELRGAIQRTLRELLPQRQPGRLLAIMNAKGGSGASTLVCNLAHCLSLHEQHTLLLDLDLQFGCVSHFFDCQPQHPLSALLQHIQQLDNAAFRGYCSPFSSHLHLLGGHESNLFLPQDITIEALDQLLHLARNQYDHVVVDLPRQIDTLTGITLEQADQLWIVLQQSVSHLKDAARLLNLLEHDMNVPRERITLLLNRFNPQADIRPADIQDALRHLPLHSLPNDYRVVSDSLNAGIPLALHAPKARITRSLHELSQQLLPVAAHTSQGGLAQAWAKLWRT